MSLNKAKMYLSIMNWSRNGKGSVSEIKYITQSSLYIFLI